VAESDPDLVVLDVMMPGMDGLGVLHNLRAAGSQVPVIFLTARDAATSASAACAPAPTTTSSSRSASRNCWPGACRAAPLGPDESREGVLRVADLELDENSHEVTRAGAEVHLTATEFELLRYLMRNERVVLSKAQISTGLEVRLPGTVQHRRALRRLPAQEGRFGRAEADPHRARRGLTSQGAPKLRPGTAAVSR